MPRFDDRFARQNRCEPPPEFPLASPYPGIVHHLSGPNSYALTQIHPRTSGSVDDAPRWGSHLRSPSLRARVWHPNTRTDVRLLGPCFKTGRRQPLRQHPRRGAVLGPGRLGCAEGSNTPRGEPHPLGLPPAARAHAGRRAGECTGANTGGSPPRRSGCRRFPFNNFTCCLTLFPKCFSSFDHSTCALSVSGRYLALDEIYHPL
jgi:hypothetical protein